MKRLLLFGMVAILSLSACTRGPLGKLDSLYWYEDYGIPSKSDLLDAQYIPNLIEAVNDENPRIGMYAVKALNKMGPAAQSSLPTLADASKNHLLNIKVRYQALEALTEIGKESPYTYETLSTLMLSGEPAKIREAAGRRMTSLGPFASPAIPSLVQALDSRYPKVRNYAALTLGSIGPLAKEALPALEKVTQNDARKTVRDSATEAIHRISYAGQNRAGQ